MKPEQQRIKIAEACGWNRFCAHEVNSVTVQYGHPPQSKLIYETPLPDYLNDLNAMRTCEESLSINDLATYADQLDKVCVPVHVCSLTHWASVTMATAAQRAEAFLKTLGLWEEEP
jgi:hypothetical protein